MERMVKPMRKHNAANERLKRDYFIYLREAKRYSEASVDAAAKALSRFEEYTGFKPFKSFHIQQAIGFKKRLAKQRARQTGKPLSKATVYSTLQCLRAFFIWVAGQPGFKSRMTYSDAEFFNLSDKEIRVAKAKRESAPPTLEQILHVLSLMPSQTDVEQRDRALIAFTLLTGARDGALASIKLKHVCLEKKKLIQDAREVNTKFSKSFETIFFPIGKQPLDIVEAWISYLRTELHWGDDDPLFPATLVAVGADQRFGVVGLERRCWKNATAIRRIFRESFERADLPYFNPHSFRKTLAQLGERLCKTPEEFKAWSQNLGHNDVMTTFTSYGGVSSSRQAEIIRNLSVAERPNDRLANALVDILEREGYERLDFQAAHN